MESSTGRKYRNKKDNEEYLVFEDDRDQVRYWNDKYELNLNLREDTCKKFLEGCQQQLHWFLHEDNDLTINVIDMKNESRKKIPVNQTRLFNCPQIDNPKIQNNAICCLNGFQNGNNKIIYDYYTQNEDMYKNKCKTLGLSIVYAHLTNEILVIDMDSSLLLKEKFYRRLLLKYPYVISMEKHLFKIFVPFIKEIMPPALLNCGFKSVNNADFLGKGSWNYVPVDNHIFNTDFDISMMSKDDFKDCPLTEPVVKENKEQKLTTTTKDYPTISFLRMKEMLEFIRECSIKEFPDEPNKRVGAVYRGDGNTCWLKICRAIKDWNSYSQGFRVLHEFSKGTPNYDEKKWGKGGQSQKDWENCDGMTVNVGYIINLYEEFRQKFPPLSFVGDATSPQEEILFEIVKNGDIDHFTLSKLLLKFDSFLLRYKYCNHSGMWYVCDETNLWSPRKNVYLSKFLDDELMPFINDVISKVEKDTESVKFLRKIRNKLGFVDFQNGILKNCIPHIMEENFSKKLDNKSTLLSFTNGVYDILTKSFRPRLPEDYISLCTFHDYVETIPQDALEFFNSFIQTISMTRKDEQDEKTKTQILEFFCKIMCMFLFGENSSNSIVIFTGEGGNGKSRLFRLHTCGLGGYIRKIEPTYFTSVKTQSHGTSPLASCQGVRLVYTSEPDENQKLQGPLLKDISGNEPFNCRKLFSNDIQLFIQFIVYFQTNSIPQITNSTDENALRRRLIIFDFPNIFCSSNEYDEDNSCLRKKKEKLDDDIQKFSPYWASYLVHLFVKYHGHVFPEKNLTPFLPKSKYLVEEYLEESNDVLNYMTQHYRPKFVADLTEDEKKQYKRSAASLTSEFNYSNKQKITARQFGKALKKSIPFKKCSFKSSEMFYCVESRGFEDGKDDDNPSLLPL